MYSSGAITKEEIDTLGKYSATYIGSSNHFLLAESTSVSTDTNIKRFMEHYRESFPESTFTPKMHFLEEHVIPWLQRWRVGFGVMGEQGMESIH